MEKKNTTPSKRTRTRKYPNQNEEFDVEKGLDEDNKHNRKPRGQKNQTPHGYDNSFKAVGLKSSKTTREPSSKGSFRQLKDSKDKVRNFENEQSKNSLYPEKKSFKFGGQTTKTSFNKKSNPDEANRHGFVKKYRSDATSAGTHWKEKRDIQDRSSYSTREPVKRTNSFSSKFSEGKYQRPQSSDSNKKQRSHTEDAKPYRSKYLQSKDSFRPNRHSKAEKQPLEEKGSDTIRLNRYIANAGICARRDADILIANGDITVNGKVVADMGYRVKITDKVVYKGKVLNPERKVYVLLNKPKGFITTLEDPFERKTVMELVKTACPERIFPVGRLDRNTSGLLLLTNDGELSMKLSHPSSNVKKIYSVELAKGLTLEDEEKLRDPAFELEDGPINLDGLSILSTDRKELGVQIHSGKNRIVRRIFESLGYEIVKLDRTVYADLTKERLPRGHWRFLTDQEVIRLKHFTTVKGTKSKVVSRQGAD